MTRDQVYISGTRYSSEALRGDARWHHIRDLGQQAKGCYTATVDGKQGVITIDGAGWWFTELPERKAQAKPDVVLDVPAFLRADTPLQLRANVAVALLSEWLSIDTWQDESIASRQLVARTRAFVAHFSSADVSPAKTQEPA